MPTYAYACTSCDHRFEAVQSFSDPSLTVCPECEGKLRKLFNSVGIVFKGSGFYRTDSRSADGAAKETKKEPAAASASSDSSSSSSSSAKSDSSSSSASSSSSGSGSSSSSSNSSASSSKPASTGSAA